MIGSLFGVTRIVGTVLSSGSGAAATFDPATLSLSGWWRAAYAGEPWDGVDSAGGSGSRDLIAGDAPAAGSAVGGYAPANYNGSSHRLIGTNCTTFLGATPSAWTCIALLKADTLASDAAPYNEPAIFSDAGGFFALSVASSGFRGYGAATTPYVPLSTGTWTMAAIKLSGGNLYAGKNAGSWTTAEPSANPSLSGILINGCNYAAGAFFDGQILEMMIAPSALSDSDLSNIKAYFNARYGLSL